MIKLPKSLKIGGHTVKVLFPHTFKDTSDFCGMAKYQTNEICVADKTQSGEIRTDSDIQVTFIHELVHWICHVYNQEQQLDEKQVNALAEGLYQALHDNKLKF